MSLQHVHSLTGEAPRAVSVNAIEAELAELWREAAGKPGEGPAVTRSFLFTLIVYAEGEAEGDAAIQAASEVMQRSPCRAIVMVAEPKAAEGGVKALISARYRLGAGGEKQVCCEQVVIRAAGGNLSPLMSAVVPLAMPDLPVQLWWRLNRFDPAKEFESLFRVTDRILVDSARFPDPALGLARLADRIAASSSSQPALFGDIAWARLTPWRELIAQFFDSPETRACLSRLNDVRLEWHESWLGEADCKSKALLIAGWLATRLGWKFVARSENARRQQILRFMAAASEVAVTLGPRSREEKGAGCFSVELKTAGPDVATFEVAERAGGSCIAARAEVPGHAPSQRVVRLEKQDEVSLVNQEMRFSYRNRIFEDAIGMVAKMTKT
jgi:glucose-6-phosphate dehydrogenase assembly protein OpcA